MIGIRGLNLAGRWMRWAVLWVGLLLCARAAPPRYDHVVIVGDQFSGNLATWSPGQTPVIVSLGADWERVAVRDAAVGPNPSRFARVVLALQP